MDFAKLLIDLVNGIFQVVVYVVGAFVAMYLYVEFSPKIELGISPRWPSGDAGPCILTITIANRSRVMVKKEDIRLQILFYNMAQLPKLSEWVPFNKSAVIQGEEPIVWRDPVRICQTTEYIHPGEAIVIERPLVFDVSNTVAHAGLKFSTKLSSLKSVLYSPFNKKNVDWTMTVFVIPAGTQKT